MGVCCNLDCEIVSQDELNAQISNTVVAHQTYEGQNTDDIEMNVDNENYKISANKRTYIHEQGVASAVWEIQHNLNRYPSVTVVDSAGDVVYCNVNYIDRNNVRLDFIGEFGGKAYLN